MAAKKAFHIISAQQFDKDFIKKIFSKALKIEKARHNKNALKGKIMSAIFYEPSTRTRLSFESAMLKLGGQVTSTENAKQFSSAAKGETLEDTIRIVHSYSDVIVLRHDKKGGSQVAANFSNVPIINAGDGSGEHPTQALLDLYTIYKKFPNILSDSNKNKRKFKITMIGDLANGRTIHSLSHLLTLYSKNVEIDYISPKSLSIPKNLRSYLKNKKVQFKEAENLAESLKNADVIYQTRIQKERFKNTEYKKYLNKYIINKESLNTVKKNAIIMHPLPRVNEISPDVDTDHRATYFSQAQNGLYIRMALLLLIFDKP